MKRIIQTLVVTSLMLAETIAAAAPAANPTTAKPNTAKPDTSAGKQVYTLVSGRAAGAVDRVEVVMEVGGDVKELVKEKVQPLKMSVVCNLGYDEKTLQVPTAASAALRTIRFYDQVSAVVKVADDGIKPELRPGRRLIGVQAELPTVTLFSPEGTLTRDELELIDILGNSALLDRLLPEKPVAVGDSWSQSEKLLVALLGVDAVSKTDVKSVLTDVTDTEARMELAGQVEGALGGVSTEIQLKAKYRFNRKTRRVDWLGLLVKENRDIGHVQRGVDAVARLQVKISPKAQSDHFSPSALKDLALTPTPESTQLTYESAEGGWRFAHDRCWHVTADQRDLAVLRMIDRGELVAQCNVAPLPKLSPGSQTSLAEFQDDVQKALGKAFGEFIEAAQSGSDANYQVYRVVVGGKVSELPIRWNYYLVTDEQGRRVVFAFTVESESARTVGQGRRETRPVVAIPRRRGGQQRPTPGVRAELICPLRLLRDRKPGLSVCREPRSRCATASQKQCASVIHPGKGFRASGTATIAQ